MTIKRKINSMNGSIGVSELTVVIGAGGQGYDHQRERSHVCVDQDLNL